MIANRKTLKASGSLSANWSLAFAINVCRFVRYWRLWRGSNATCEKGSGSEVFLGLRTDIKAKDVIRE
jgi:hypothetical protein